MLELEEGPVAPLGIGSPASKVEPSSSDDDNDSSDGDLGFSIDNGDSSEAEQILMDNQNFSMSLQLERVPVLESDFFALHNTVALDTIKN